MKKLIFLMGIALSALFPFFVYGQLLDPVDYTITEVPDTVKAGEVFEVTVVASIDDKWHLYSTQNEPDAGPFPTQFSTASSKMKIAGKVSESEPTIAFDPNFETNLGWHSEAAEFRIPVLFNKDEQGLQSLLIEVLYQTCDDRSCLPPKTKQIEEEIFLAGVVHAPTNEVLENSNVSMLTVVEWFWLIFSVGITISFVYLLVRRHVRTNE